MPLWRSISSAARPGCEPGITYSLTAIAWASSHARVGLAHDQLSVPDAPDRVGGGGESHVRPRSTAPPCPDAHTGGLYSPNSSRITLQTSPSVARSRSASLIG